MRRIVLGALALVLVVIAVVAIVAVRDDSDDDNDGRARPEAGVTRPDDAVYRIRHAATAVPGEDYEVLHEIPGPIAYKAQAMLDDGTLVLTHTSRYGRDTGDPLPDLVQLWDPATERRATIPVRWPRYVTAVAATGPDDVWISFVRPGPTGKVRPIMHYDRTTGRSRVYTAPPVPQARRDHVVEGLRAGPDGRIYFLTGSDVCVRVNCLDREDRQLWSFAPASPQRVRREATDVESYAVSETHLAWVEPQDDFQDSSKRLSVRPHGTDRVRTTEVAECHTSWPAPLVQIADTLVLACGDLYDERARRVARLDIYSHGLTGVTDRWVAYGWTVLEPATGRLLQILDDRIWHNRAVVMNGDRILFPGPEGPPNARNADWTLARLIPS